MYLTKNYDCKNEVDFDWKLYFSTEESIKTVKDEQLQEIFQNTRGHLRENKFQLVLSLNTLMKKLLLETKVNKPNILELGAATGVLTRWLISQYGGKGTLVDINKASYDSYISIKDRSKESITYVLQDIFTLDLEEEYDVVCSFGLIEHFKEKKEILKYHKKFLSEDGIIIIIVPMDSKLTRVFFEVHPEQNLGYRELLTEKELKKVLEDSGLNIIKTEISSGYVYDFVAAICRDSKKND